MPSGATDPQASAGPDGRPPGAESIQIDRAKVTIEGGPVPVAIERPGDWASPVVEALRSQDAKALYAFDEEFANFWCPTCEKSYCKDHWQTDQVFDEGFFDYVEGFCPQGHRRMLMD